MAVVLESRLLRLSGAGTNAFDAIAKDIETSVRQLRYPKSTADELVKLVRDWNLETWKQKLAQGNPLRFTRKPAEIARCRREMWHGCSTTRSTRKYVCSEEEMGRHYYLPVVIKDRRRNVWVTSTLHFSNSVGLSVAAVNVSESATGLLPPDMSHAVSCRRSDSTSICVDLMWKFVSSPFAFQDEYVAVGDYWELKHTENPLRSTGVSRHGMRMGYWAAFTTVRPRSGERLAVLRKHFSLYDEAIEINPKYAEPFNNRGYLV